jgi:hypothetical protein
MPFYNVSRGVRCILLRTRNQRKDFGSCDIQHSNLTNDISGLELRCSHRMDCHLVLYDSSRAVFREPKGIEGGEAEEEGRAQWTATAKLGCDHGMRGEGRAQGRAFVTL